MITKPMRCPKCGHWVNFTYFDTAGQHWECPKCGNSSENQTIIYSTTTKSKETKMTNADKLRQMSDNELLDFLCDIAWQDFPFDMGDNGYDGGELYEAFGFWLEKGVED